MDKHLNELVPWTDILQVKEGVLGLGFAAAAILNTGCVDGWNSETRRTSISGWG
jgi:hypothetical protein